MRYRDDCFSLTDKTVLECRGRVLLLVLLCAYIFIFSGASLKLLVHHSTDSKRERKLINFLNIA